MPAQNLERLFPGLRPGCFRIASPESPNYNCAAWAAGETHRCWDAYPEHGAYWPPGAPPWVSLGNLTAVFATLGYKACESAAAESGFEKIALYADDQGWPTHVARQMPSGAWTSKRGALEDIEHATLESLEGDRYGRVVRILWRSVARGG
jgi:hypothetical protein